MATQQEPELPTIARSLCIETPPVFLRVIARPTPWIDALKQNDPDPSIGEAYFIEEDESDVSFWRVDNDKELLLATIAMNDGRSSLHETIDFLTILKSDFDEAGISTKATPGTTNCQPAKALHFSAEINSDMRLELSRILFKSNRHPRRCTKGEMRKVEQMAKADKCFAAVSESKLCACGASR